MKGKLAGAENCPLPSVCPSVRLSQSKGSPFSGGEPTAGESHDRATEPPTKGKSGRASASVCQDNCLGELLPSGPVRPRVLRKHWPLSHPFLGAAAAAANSLANGNDKTMALIGGRRGGWHQSKRHTNINRSGMALSTVCSLSPCQRGGLNFAFRGCRQRWKRPPAKLAALASSLVSSPERLSGPASLV